MLVSGSTGAVWSASGCKLAQEACGSLQASMLEVPVVSPLGNPKESNGIIRLGFKLCGKTSPLWQGGDLAGNRVPRQRSYPIALDGKAGPLHSAVVGYLIVLPTVVSLNLQLLLCCASCAEGAKKSLQFSAPGKRSFQ